MVFVVSWVFHGVHGVHAVSPRLVARLKFMKIKIQSAVGKVFNV